MVDENEFDIMDADHESRLMDIDDDCPMCGSDDIEYRQSPFGEKSVCRDCGYKWIEEDT
jgi:transposase-like protein